MAEIGRCLATGVLVLMAAAADAAESGSSANRGLYSPFVYGIGSIAVFRTVQRVAAFAA